MATIKELVEKHSKIPGDIRITVAEWSDCSYFRPYFCSVTGHWYGHGENMETHIFSDNEHGHSHWQLYEDHTPPKVKRAQYLVHPKGGLPRIPDWFYKDDEEFRRQYGDSDGPFTRLMDTERVFER